MLIVAGYLEVDPLLRADYLDLAINATRQAREAPGCLAFVQAPDPLDPRRIVIYERWESEARLLAFRNSAPDEDAAPLPDILGADVRRFEVASEGPA